MSKYSFLFDTVRFENFLLFERLLINVTLVKSKHQANFKEFKRFGAFKGLVEHKNVVFYSFVCKLGSLWYEWASLHTNSLNNILLFVKNEVSYECTIRPKIERS
jgi:hypothetical protein